MVVAGREVDHPLEQRGRPVAVVQEVPHVVAGRVQLILAVDAQKLRLKQEMSLSQFF